jgi:hypothetical protein
MIGKIVLWIYDRKGAPWVGEHIFDDLDGPRVDQGVLCPEEENFLIGLAQCIHVWHPYDNALSGSRCKPRSIYESLWIWLEAETPYWKFEFKPPLEIRYAEGIPGNGLAKE